MGNCANIDILATEARALLVGYWEEVIQVKNDELFENLEQAMIVGGLALGAFFFVGAIVCRIYAFLFPSKGPFFWEEGYYEEEATSEEEGDNSREREEWILSGT